MASKSIYKKADGKTRIESHYEDYLKSWKIEVERVNIPTSYGNTHTLTAGPKEGKPVFIFQGGNCINPMTLSWFLPQAKEYRIIAPDTIGHPGFSEENRISARDESFAQWIIELMSYFDIEKSAFIGPSYGAGIILRLAAYHPEKISCSVLVSPAGIKLGSKTKMIKEILLPMILFNTTSSDKHLKKLTGRMSDNSMKKRDQEIIGDIFKHVRLEQEMPKLTERSELSNYHAPTLVIAGKKDVFFPEGKISRAANEIIPNLTNVVSLDMGHFPSEQHLVGINGEITEFLKKHY